MRFNVLRVRDAAPIPAFNAGQPMVYKEIVKKYGIKIGRDARYVWHIMCVHIYLRCFGCESLPHIVTSDPNFKKNKGRRIWSEEITPKQQK